MDEHDPDGLTLDELCAETGESRRTVRFYILNGLLTAPSGAGPAARYPREHARRLRVIRALQAEGRQLAAIRDLLERTPEGDLDGLLRRESPRPPAGTRSSPVSTGSTSSAPPAPLPESDDPSPTGLYRSQWDHLTLWAGVELHVRRPLGTATQRRVQKLLDFARSLGAGGEP
ncbi:helix-turn-helix domain-containing protein [Myxococcota bacterium]|nr:helix-turn-helix domain-containing protein [Myxococcota bacterium]